MSSNSDEPSGQMHECEPVEPQRASVGPRARSLSPESATPRPDLDEREAGTSPERKSPGPPVQRGDADDIAESAGADREHGATTDPARPAVPEAVREAADDELPS